jgi:regulator of protease activity HflC (stomatin/prohibitin superfamily)
MTEPTPDAPATDAPATDTPQPKPTETVDYWKQRSRENETKAKANAEAARRLAEIEESQKTEAQKTADRLAAAEKDAASARAEALRLRIASKFGIGDEDADLFLTGSDEATLTKQAERLTAREADRKKQGNHVPREGSPTSAGGGELSEFRSALFDNAG